MSWDTAGNVGGSWGGATTTSNEPPSNEFSGGATSFGDNAGVFGGSAGFGDDAGAGNSGGCYNCGENGHNKADCPNPPVAREFTGTCRLCEQTGHRAAECPSAPPKLCKNCNLEGHEILDCKNPRKIDRSHIPDVPAEIAWGEMKEASAECDLDDFKKAAQKYIKATPDATYVQLERGFRGQNFSVYLIALEKELAVTYTNMDLQGNLDKKFTVSWRLSPNHQRPKEKDFWPATPEENLERLQDAGEPVDRGVPLCSNCNVLGHIAKKCPEEKVENPDRAEVKCYNCENTGHRVRDCPNPRPDKYACKNCHRSGHISKECPEPRSAEGVECKRCNETGHFAKDCPTGGGPRTCRNCDSTEHMAKECTKPKDWSRVQCSNCKKLGHTKVRCKEPLVEDEDAGHGGASHGGGYGEPAADTGYGGAGDSSGGGFGELSTGQFGGGNASAPATTGWKNAGGGSSW